MSRKIQDIVAIIDRVALNPEHKTSISKARQQAAAELARERGVDTTTVTNSFRRNLAPHIKGTEDFDCQLEAHLFKEEAPLMDILKFHCTSDEDLDLVESLYGEHRVNSLSRDIMDLSSLPGTERETQIKCRLGQGKFREALMQQWQGRCMASYSTLKTALRASHIKPWASCTDEERLDPYNGLLLSANYDVLFDQGYISFDFSGRIMISDLLPEVELKCLGINPQCMLSLQDEHQAYLDFHREHIFLYEGKAEKKQAC